MKKTATLFLILCLLLMLGAPFNASAEANEVSKGASYTLLTPASEGYPDDGKKHEMSAALARAFVTPIDREDLDLISHNIDDVTDNIEEVLQRFYMNRITTVLPDAVEFARKLENCCALMKDIMVEFVNFKKSTKLHDMIVELNHVEEECDRLYLLAVYNLRDHCTDVLDIISWREIYDCLEACADACEHVSECVGTVIMKNT